jgi:tRNA (cytidine/uridine-2'-O-)-methyltransferase
MARIVLFQPEIPPNTGNIARTCAATGAELHLIEPLGFSIDDRQLRRAGLDYWPSVDLHRHGDFDAFQAERQRRGGRLVALSSQAHTSCYHWRFRADDWLLFGRESEGLPPQVLSRSDAALTIPMPRYRPRDGVGVRSLNLSVAVGVVMFESLRQLSLAE